jgi:hypothetical protein
MVLKGKAEKQCLSKICGSTVGFMETWRLANQERGTKVSEELAGSIIRVCTT